MVGVSDRFGESGEPGELMDLMGITYGDIVDSCRISTVLNLTFSHSDWGFHS